MAINITSIKTASNGAWQGDNPLNYAFPLLTVQTILILFFSRSLALLLKPLRQPKVIAEIIGGILLGPSALGRNETFLNTIFPKWSEPILETVASIGLLFFLFLVGLELDLNSIRRSGKKSISIAAAGISVPFVSGIGVAFALRHTVTDATAKFTPFLVFIGVALSITAFPVLARILAELKLLTTPTGEMAMAAAACNDVAAWILLALAVALSGGGSHQSPLISMWILLSGVAFVLFMAFIIRPAIVWLSQRRINETVDEAYICLTLAGVFLSGFVTDLIGIHAIFGAFLLGLMIPKEGEFAEKLTERIEDFVSGLLLPLYFASSGLKTDVTKIIGWEAWGMLCLVIATACIGKIGGTFVVSFLHRIPAREAATLGVLMNTKGLVELIVLNIGKERKVLNDATFAILVLMALFTTFITSPLVIAIYKPFHGVTSYYRRKLQRDCDDMSVSSTSTTKELRLLACLHNPHNVSSTINLIETMRGTKQSPLKLYIMHLVELTERSSSIVMALRARKNGVPFLNPLFQNTTDGVTVAFETYGQLGRVRVRPMTGISSIATMHEDICSIAGDKKVAMVILPFHKQWRFNGDGNLAIENIGLEWRMVNQKVLKCAPCSVSILVDRGFGQPRLMASIQQICVLFFGGPDDREAIELGSRMAEHPGVAVHVFRFVPSKEEEESNPVKLRPSPEKSAEWNYSFSTALMDLNKEKELDEAALAEFRSNREGQQIGYEEWSTDNIIESVIDIGRSERFHLIIVGRGRFPSSMVATLAELTAEHAELGPIADILASTVHGVRSSILVVQQHDVIHENEIPVTKIVDV